MRKPNVALVLVTALLASCSPSAVPVRTFEIRAINEENEAVKCIIVVDRKWPTERDKAVYTPGTVDVSFIREEMTITVKEVAVDDEGNIRAIPTELSPSQYKAQSRDVQANDPRVHLFILSRDYSRSR